VSKLFPVLLFVVALFIAGNAAYFSVKGIGLLFAGSFLPVVVMASSLELGKLFAVSLLYRKWYEMSRLLRYYLAGACIALIGITSLGIFGFLTDAYQDTKSTVDFHQAEIDSLTSQNDTLRLQAAAMNQTKTKTAAQVVTSTDNYKEIYDKYEERQTGRILQLNNRVAELDKAVSDLQAQAGGIFSNKKKKLEQLKAEQQAERVSLANEIDSINDNIKQEYDMFLQKIDSLSTKGVDVDIVDESTSLYDSITENDRTILEHKSAINRTDIGSFKFIANAFGVDIETAVKWFIILIVVVFDPLAICLVIGYNMYMVTQDLNKKMAQSQPRHKIPVETNKSNKKVIVLGRGKQ
jgi:hypothetical protein